MKKIKKLTSQVLALSLMASLCPTVNNIASAEINMSNLLTRTVEDFESYELGVEGTSKFTGTASQAVYEMSDAIDVVIQGEGNCVEVAQDPYTGSKALKVTYSGAGSIQISNWFDKSIKNKDNTNCGIPSSNIVSSEYKARFENYANNSYITEFNSFYDSHFPNKWYTSVGIKGYLGSVYYANGDYVKSVAPIDLTSTEYFTSSAVYNVATGDTVVFTDGEVKTTYCQSGYAGKRRTARAVFGVGLPSAAPAASWLSPDGDSTQPTVFWLDDLVIDYINYSVADVKIGGLEGMVTVKNISGRDKVLTNVPLNAPIEIIMNSECSDECVTKDYFKLEDQNGPIDYDLEKEGNSVIIYPKDQEISTTYTVTVETNIKAQQNVGYATLEQKTVSYTTCSDGLEFKGYVENMNFDDFDDAVYSTQGYHMNDKLWIYTVYEGDSVAIETDPVTGSKALKLTRAISNINDSNAGMSKFNYVFDNAYSSGKLVANVDVRIANNNGGTTSFINFGDSASNGTNSYISSNFLGGTYWWHKTGDQWINENTWNKDAYFPVNMTVDLVNGKYSGEVYRPVTDYLMCKNKDIDKDNVPDVKYMNLVDFRNSTLKSGRTADSVIYIDNIKIAHYDYKELSVENVSINDTDVIPSNEVSITMNDIVSNDCLNTDYFALTDDEGDPIENITVTKNGKEVILSFEDSLEYGKTYMLTVMPGVKSSTNNVMDMKDSFVFPFSTADKKFDTKGASAQIVGDTLTVSGAFKNFTKSAQNVTYYVALFEGNNLVAVEKAAEGNVLSASGLDISAEFTIEEGKAYKACGFAWDGMYPLDSVCVFN